VRDALKYTLYENNPYGADQIVDILAYYFKVDRPDILTAEQRMLSDMLATAIERTVPHSIDGFHQLAKGLIELGMELQHDGHATLAKKNGNN
jgi:hypothetical protein